MGRDIPPFELANARYEAWLATQCAVVRADLREKHGLMAESPFLFLRATFFRWAGCVESWLPALHAAPAVLAVGDIHVDNFGAWRDAEGRLAWGVNDFDEAAPMPYPFDLARLATSARLAGGVGARAAAGAILKGYAQGLAAPNPIAMHEQYLWLRRLVSATETQRRDFWAEIDGLKKARAPEAVAAAFARVLPAGAAIEKISRVAKGGGSRGRPRFQAVARWRGDRIVREAKAIVPSAWGWAHGRPVKRSHFLDLAYGPHRCPDPFLRAEAGFVFRRIAPDSHKLAFADIPAESQLRVLKLMGRDLGALHAADESAARAIGRHLRKLPADWLHEASKICAAGVAEDHAAWRKAWKAQRRR